MKRLILLFFLIIISYLGFTQSRDTIFNVSISTPSSWFSIDTVKVDGRNKYFEFKKKEVLKIIPDYDTPVFFAEYYKYKPIDTHKPSIRYVVKATRVKSLHEFFLSIKLDFEDVRKIVDNFKYEDTARVITINNRQAFYASETYSNNTPKGKIDLRSRQCFIFLGDVFVGVSMIDNPKDDCSEIFFEAIKKMEIEITTR